MSHLQPHLRRVFRRSRQTKSDPDNNQGYGIAHTNRDRAESDRSRRINPSVIPSEVELSSQTPRYRWGYKFGVGR